METLVLVRIDKVVVSCLVWGHYHLLYPLHTLYIFLHPVLEVIVEWSHLNVRDHPDQFLLKPLDLKLGRGFGCTLESIVLLLLLLLEWGLEPEKLPSHGCDELL